VNLNSSVQSEDQTIALDIRSAGVSSGNLRYNFPHVAGKVTYSGRLVTAQDLTIDRNGSHIRLDGVINLDGPSGDLAVNADDLNLLDLDRISRHA